jgi:hypothetical protein
MKVTLNYFVDVDTYAEKEFYYGTIQADDKTIYSHEDNLKCFSYKEDMVKHLHRVVAELGYEVIDTNDYTYAPSMWEEYL